MTKAIEKADKGIVAKYTTEELDLIKNTVAKGTTDEQLMLFLYQANHSGLDPLAKQIHCVLRWNNATKSKDMAIQIAIDGFRLIADRTGKYAGNDDPVFDVDDADHPNKATVTVYKMVEGTRCGFSATARWKEYCPQSDKQAFMWKKMPYVMLGKCAEALALRKAFPAELSGLYSDDEMHQADKKETQVVKMEEPVVEAEEVKEEKEIKMVKCAVCDKDVPEYLAETLCNDPVCPDCFKPTGAVEQHVEPSLTKTVRVRGDEIQTAGANADQLEAMMSHYEKGKQQEEQIKYFLKEIGLKKLSHMTYEQAQQLCDIITEPKGGVDKARKEFWATADKILGKDFKENMKKMLYQLHCIDSMSKMTERDYKAATNYIKTKEENKEIPAFRAMLIEKF